MENVTAFSTGILTKFTDIGCKDFDASPAKHAVSERIDSGFESLQNKQLKKMEGENTNHEHQEKSLDGVPVEIFLTGRKVVARIYTQCNTEPSDGIQDLSRSHKVKLEIKREFRHILPILQVEVLHPAVIVNTSSMAPKIKVTCFDATVTGAEPKQGKYLFVVFCSFKLLFRVFWRVQGRCYYKNSFARTALHFADLLFTGNYEHENTREHFS